MAGQLGDPVKMSQPSPVSAVADTQGKPAESAAVSTPISKLEPAKVETMSEGAPTKIEPNATPTVSKVSPVTTETKPSVVSTAEPIKDVMTTMQDKISICSMPNPNISETIPAEGKEKSVEVEPTVMEVFTTGESKLEPPTPPAPCAAVTSAVVSIDTTVAFTTPIAAEVAMASSVVPGQAQDPISLTSSSLQQDEEKTMSQIPQLASEVEPLLTPDDSNQLADKLLEKTDAISSLVPQTVVTEIIISVRTYPLHKYKLLY